MTGGGDEALPLVFGVSPSSISSSLDFLPLEISSFRRRFELLKKRRIRSSTVRLTKERDALTQAISIVLSATNVGVSCRWCPDGNDDGDDLYSNEKKIESMEISSIA